MPFSVLGSPMIGALTEELKAQKAKLKELTRAKARAEKLAAENIAFYPVLWYAYEKERRGEADAWVLI